MSNPSPSPVRYPGGVSTDFPYGALANFGLPNPLSYHLWEDDFDVLNSGYTVTKTGSGTLAVTAAQGGALKFTTNASTPLASDLVSLQLPAGSFSFTAGKKCFFLTRLQSSDVVDATLLAGLMEITTTPGAATDGVYFSKLSGASNTLNLISNVGGVASSLAIPANAYSLADNTNIDLAFYVDRNQRILAFVNAQLVGYVTQSGNGGPRGPVAGFAPPLTTSLLSPTLAVISGTAASHTMTADFILAAMER